VNRGGGYPKGREERHAGLLQHKGRRTKSANFSKPFPLYAEAEGLWLPPDKAEAGHLDQMLVVLGYPD
jgi:hypothetical protein